MTGPTNAPRLLVSLAAATVLRAAIAGPQGAASRLAGGVFAVLCLGTALAGGWRSRSLGNHSVAWGLAGAAALVIPAATRYDGRPPVHGAGSATVLAWAVVVSAIAVGEEVLIRGALWHALLPSIGRYGTLAVTSLVFAIIHLPLYGATALPLDLAAGLLLGALRLLSAGPAAPAIAHLVADLAGGWL